MELIENELSPLLRQIMLPLRAKFQFYAVPRHFKKVEVRREISDFASSYYWKMIKLIYFYRKDKKEVFDTKYEK